jgi:hypothetical protein
MLNLSSSTEIGALQKEPFIMDKKGLLIVMARVKPEDEEAFNKWYNEEHLPKAIERFPGVLSGRKRLLAVQLKALTVG